MLKKILFFQLLAATALFSAHPVTQKVKKHVLDVVTTSRDVKKIIADYLTTERLTRPNLYKTITTGKTNIAQLTVSPNGKYLASLSEFGTVTICDANTYKLIHQINSKWYWFAAKQIFFFSDNTHLASFYGDRLDIINLNDFSLKVVPFPDYHTVCDISPDNLYCVCGSYSGAGAKIYKIQYPKIISTVDSNIKAEKIFEIYLYTGLWDDNNIRQLAFSPTGKNLAIRLDLSRLALKNDNKSYTRFYSQCLCIIDVDIKERKYFNQRTIDLPCTRFTYAPNGETIALVCKWRTDWLYIIDTKTDKYFVINANVKGPVGQLTYSPNGQYMVRVEEQFKRCPCDRTIDATLFTLNGKDDLVTLSSQQNPVFSPDGTQLFTTQNNTIHAWDLKTRLEWEEEVSVSQQEATTVAAPPNQSSGKNFQSKIITIKNKQESTCSKK